MELSMELKGFDELLAALRQAPEIVSQELNAFAHGAVNQLGRPYTSILEPISGTLAILRARHGQPEE